MSKNQAIQKLLHIPYVEADNPAGGVTVTIAG